MAQIDDSVAPFASPKLCGLLRLMSRTDMELHQTQKRNLCSMQRLYSVV